MLETLVYILGWDLPSPEILLEEDGDICLDWCDWHASVIINRSGGVSWAILDPGVHGTDLDELKTRLLELADGDQGA